MDIGFALFWGFMIYWASMLLFLHICQTFFPKHSWLGFAVAAVPSITAIIFSLLDLKTPLAILTIVILSALLLLVLVLWINGTLK